MVIPSYPSSIYDTPNVTGSRKRVWEDPLDRGKFWEPAHYLAYLLF